MDGNGAPESVNFVDVGKGRGGVFFTVFKKIEYAYFPSSLLYCICI